jgi:hypothetical protein
MKSTLSVTLFLASVCILQSGCGSGDLFAPATSEALPVVVTGRVAVQGETVPAVHVVSGNILLVRVTTHAACATIVTAGIKRTPGEITVVSHVSGSPVANCAPVAGLVVDYSGTIDGLAAGTYRVRVFEGQGDGTPTFIGSAVATISPAA